MSELYLKRKMQKRNEALECLNEPYACLTAFSKIMTWKQTEKNKNPKVSVPKANPNLEECQELVRCILERCPEAGSSVLAEPYEKMPSDCFEGADVLQTAAVKGAKVGSSGNVAPCVWSVLLAVGVMVVGVFGLVI